MRRIGIYGGTFNPVHLAHLAAAEEACESLSLERVVFVPAKLPPHKEAAALAGARDRLRMVRLAVAGNPRFEASGIELRREGPSYSVDTVEAMRRRFGRSADLYFLIGTDTVAELPAWREVARLATLCKFVPLSRPGAKLPTASALARAVGRKAASGILSRTIRMPLLEISASDIRMRVAEGRSIQYLVPASVAAYIGRRGLYRPGAPPRVAPGPRRRCSGGASRRSSARPRRARG